MTRVNLSAVALLLLAGLFDTGAAQAAESYDNCTGFITSLPAVISTQGTWCLKQDLATAVNNGNAITINANNVTIDCNYFKLGGLAAGVGTHAYGIYGGAYGAGLQNVTVRHCNIRGFFEGVYFEGVNGGGHTIEDNRFEGNTYFGLQVEGDGSVVRRNRIFDTGASTWPVSAFVGIYAADSADILDNTVSGVTGSAGSNGNTIGIFTVSNFAGSISGNRVRGALKSGTGNAYGIYNNLSDRITLTQNHLVGDTSAGSTGLLCASANGSGKDNVVSGFATAVAGCSDDGGNVIKP